MKYRYRVLDKAGRAETGFIEADAEGNARTEIKNRGLYLVSLKEVSNRQDKKKSVLSFSIPRRLPIQLARQLSSLLKGGVPLFQALSIITNQLGSEKEREIVGYLRDQVREGTPLSEALKACPKVFDELFIYSVQAGERSGALDSILTYQADLLEDRAVLRGRIKTALVYPAIMTTVGSGVLLFLMVYVVPMVMKIFERMNQQLPLVTRILIGLADFVNSYLYIGAIGIAAGLALLSRWIRGSARGRLAWDAFLLNLPVYGNLYNMILVNRFARIMATLLKSGVTMVQSIVVVSRTMKSTIARDSVMKMAQMVEGGSDLSAALRTTTVFPSYVADMVAVGESTGNIEEMLARVAEYYEIHVNQKITAFTSMVEPVIILSMGVIVAFVLVSVLLPLFEMNKILVK
ncbi:type II secretion system F family protein [Syntrophorhabdus aromaticivorans]|uniref:type II secretion system F family protein n=1 Tax=Syntrophorhabdus aromaticivorans TaxID=328301 RepID=UPI0004052EA2|nr:type II secretion system F family protein [Syntrophorhabdus aromaticivorans]